MHGTQQSRITAAIRSSLLATLAMLTTLACADDDAGMDASTGGDATSAPTGSTGSTGTPAESSGGPPSDGSSTGMTDASAGSSGAPAVDYAGEIQPIWDAACTCHLQGPSGTMTATTLTLNAEVSYDELVGTTATQTDLPRVAPGDLEGSYLWHKLHGTQMDVGGIGTAMPQIGMLSADELALIEAWIAGGAPP